MREGGEEGEEWDVPLAPTRILPWVFVLRKRFTRPQGNYSADTCQRFVLIHTHNWSEQDFRSVDIFDASQVSHHAIFPCCAGGIFSNLI